MILRELAARLGCTLRGDGDVEVHRVAGIEDAGPGDLTFVANPRYVTRLAATRASAVIVAPDLETPLPSLLTPNPYLAFARAVALLHPQPSGGPGRAPVGAGGPDRAPGRRRPRGRPGRGGAPGARGRPHGPAPHVVLYADVQVGEDCLLHSGVQVREGCRLGHRVIVQNGAVIGARRLRLRPRLRGPLPEDPAGGHRGGGGRRGDRGAGRHRPRGPAARRASAGAPRSTTSSRSATRSRSARTPCWPGRWGSRGARASAAA